MNPDRQLKYIGKEIISLSSIPSTNDYALKLISESKVEDGTFIYTYNQTQGKGQRNKEWFSVAGKNICATAILKLDFLTLDKIFLFNKAMALAVKDFIQSKLNTLVQIKWPNDILVAEKKISGILIQNAISGKKIKHSVLGIGININQEEFPENLPNAVSLKQLSNKEYDIENLLNELLYYLDTYYLKLLNGEIEQIELEYLKSLYKRGENSFFIRNGNEQFSASIEDVNNKGQLGISYQGKINYWNHGEIEHLL